MNSFKRNTIFATCGNLSTTFALACIVFGTARLGGPEAIGRFSYALAVCAPIFLLAALRLRDVGASESDASYSLGTFLLTSVLTNSVAILTIIPTGLLLGLDRSTLVTALLLGCWKFVSALSNVVYGHHQREIKMLLIAKLQIIHGICSIFVFTACLLLTKNLLMAVALLSVTNVLVFLAFDTRTIDLPGLISDLIGSLRSHFRKAIILCATTLPLGLAGAIFALNMLIPRSMLDNFFTLKDVGIFAILAFFARLGTPIMQGIGQTTSRQLSVAFHENEATRFKKLLTKVIAIPVSAGLILVLLGWFVGAEMLLLIYGEQYVVQPLSVVSIMIYATLVYISTYLTYALIAARRHGSQLVILIVTIVATLACCYFLIPKYGVLGACLSLMMSSIVRVIGTGLVVWLILGSMIPKEFSPTGSPRDIRAKPINPST